MGKNNKKIALLGLVVFVLIFSIFTKVKNIIEQMELIEFNKNLQNSIEKNDSTSEDSIINFDDDDFVALKGMDYLEYDNTLTEVNNRGIYLEDKDDIEISKIIEIDTGYVIVGSIKVGEGRFEDKVKDGVTNAIIIKLNNDLSIENYNTYTLKSDTIEFSDINYSDLKGEKLGEKTEYRTNDVDNTFLDVVQDEQGNYVTIGCSLYFDGTQDKGYYAGTIAKYNQNLQLVGYDVLESENNVMFSKITNSIDSYGVGTVFVDDTVLDDNTGKVEATVVKYDKSLENSNIGEKVTLLDRKKEQKVAEYIFDYYEYSSKLLPTIPDSYIKGIVEIENEFILLCNAVDNQEVLSGGEDYIINSTTFGKVVVYDEKLNINKYLDYTKNNLKEFNGLLFKDILVNDKNELIIVGDITYTYGEYTDEDYIQGSIVGGKNGGFNKDYKFKPSEVFILTLSPKLDVINEKIFNVPYIYYKQNEDSDYNFYLDENGNHIKLVEDVNDLQSGELFYNREKIFNIQQVENNYIIYGKSGYLNSELVEKLPEEYSSGDDIDRCKDTYITILNEDFNVLKSFRLTSETLSIMNDFTAKENGNVVLVGNSDLEYGVDHQYYNQDINGKAVVCEFKFDYE